ncbi:glycosyltransferase [Staphylococcus gallinarum]|uniref:Glycosyltransferase n=1 Tax=Staphylococcus gallinarum TaxID=1293 RepID=A0A380FMX1_STAGA|nr:glycosyltransferase [Staphylococcus gallinarum]
MDSDDYIHQDTLKDGANSLLNVIIRTLVLVKMEGVNGRGVPKSMFTETKADGCN